MHMRTWYGLCHPGAEQALVRELAAHNIKGTPLLGGVLFEVPEKGAAQLLYSTIVMTRMLLATGHGTLDDIDYKAIHKILPPEETFRVEVDVIAGAPERAHSQAIAQDIGHNIDRPVDLSKPQHTVFCMVGAQVICGIDIAGDLSKRYYRVFTNPGSIKGTLAAGALLNWNIEQPILDPFGNTGEIAIEAALYFAKQSPLRFTKHQRIDIIDAYREKWEDIDPEKTTITCYDTLLANVRSSKKNAKLAGVEKQIEFSKIDIEWLDTKFDENSVKTIITCPRAVTKRQPETTHLKELCYQAEFVLEKGGALIVLCETDQTSAGLAKHAAKHKLILEDETVLFSGKHPYHLVRYVFGGKK